MPEAVTVANYAAIGRMRAANRPAVVSVPEGRAVTYRELDERTTRVANALLGLGLAPGDRVACWLATSLAYVDVYLGAAKAGLVVVPVNERYTSAEAGVILGDAAPRVLVFDATTAARVAELQLGDAMHLVEVGACRSTEALPFTALLDGSAGQVSARPAPGDPCLLGYTSGTTGQPKGAVLTHGGLVAINRSNAIAYHLVTGSVALFTGSMSFTATVPALMLTHLYVGGTVVITGTRDPAHAVAMVSEHAANYLAVPPPLVADYAAEFARHRAKLGSLVTVLQSAGPAVPEHLGALNDALDGRLILGWGMTENSGGLATVSTAHDLRRGDAETARTLASVGRAVPGCRVQMVDPAGAVLDADGTAFGELAITTDSLMAGYWRRPDETTAVLRDGWYCTGDVGRIDPDGLVTILDRRSDLIVSGGMNVYPNEVEAVLRQLPGVADCAVVGIPHVRWGRAVAAAIVVAPGATVTEDDVEQACRARLASYKKPVATVFVEALPRTVGDKVHRASVVNLFRPR